MPNTLTINSTNLSTYGAYITGTGIYSAPEREYDWYSIPNRDGDILGLKRRLRNNVVSYDLVIYNNIDTNLTNLRNFLYSLTGLIRISDSAHTDEFRMGVYEGPFEPIVTADGNLAAVTLEFKCQPQRWLTSGETEASQTITPSSTTKISLTVTNPTNFPSRPLLKVYGTGTLTVNNTDIIISDTLPSGVSYLIIDCDTMAIYRSGYTTNYNPYVSMKYGNEYGVDFPTLKSGVNTISTAYSQNISQVKVTPRWWRV